MNWFLFATAVLYVLASGYEAWHTRWRMAIVYLAYAVATFALATLKEK